MEKKEITVEDFNLLSAIKSTVSENSDVVVKLKKNGEYAVYANSIKRVSWKLFCQRSP